MCVRPPGLLGVSQRAGLDLACCHPGEVLVRRGPLQDRRGWPPAPRSAATPCLRLFPVLAEPPATGSRAERGARVIYLRRPAAARRAYGDPPPGTPVRSA